MKKTWLKVIEETTLSEQCALLEVISEVNVRLHQPTTVCLSGIPVLLTPEESCAVVRADILKEQMEHVQLCKKYNELKLPREAIIKTNFFNKIVRSTDNMMHLFFFETFDEDGTVWADMQSLRDDYAYVFYKIGALEDKIEDLEDPHGKVTWMYEEVQNITEEMKNGLWPKRTDAIEHVGRKRISITLPSAPLRAKKRLVEWRKAGYTAKVIAHRNSLGISIGNYFDKTLERLDEKLGEFSKKYSVAELKKLEAFRNFLTHKVGAERKDDPILYVHDGSWTVVVDQYATFSEEEKIIATIKSHYTLLREKYGIITTN